MKLPFHYLLLAFTLLTACHSPRYFVQKGDLDKAIVLYCAQMQKPSNSRYLEKNGADLESIYAQAQGRDSITLERLYQEGRDEYWPAIHDLHLRIQERQQRVSQLPEGRTRKGQKLVFPMMPSIDSLESESRHHAAAFLYAHAQALLAIADSTQNRRAAQEAYYTLCDLKSNYFPIWEETNALLDSARQEGKIHVLLQTGGTVDPSDGQSFWESIQLNPSTMKSEWLVIYPESAPGQVFDYVAHCQLVSLYIGSECNSSTEQIETKQVEDGFDEVRDSSGQVVSRTLRYKTETTVTTTYYSSRRADATVLLELEDTHTGQIVWSTSIPGYYSYEDSSTFFTASSPSYWGMIDRVADDVEWGLRRALRAGLGE